MRSFRYHASNYAWAEAAVTLAGIVSFPILTRLLSVADYGTMNLVTSALGLTVALGKLGVQHAVLRSRAEAASGRAGYALESFESTVLWGMLGSGVFVTLAWLAAASSVPDHWWGERGVAAVMLLATPLIVIRVLDSGLVNDLRAREASAALAIYGTVRRYVVLVAIVGALWWWRRDLATLYAATIAAEALALLLLLAWMFRGRPWPAPSGFSWPLFASLALFGLPMLGSELSHVVLAMGDRFVIQRYLGAEELGIYAASHNMCDYLRNALLGALAGAAYPRCVRLWESGHRAELERFLATFMHHYVAAALFLVALMAVAGGELMSLLASAKFARGAEVTGWIMAGLAVQTVLSVAAIGLLLAKRSLLVMVLVAAAGALSVLANVVLVPWIGIRGAAVSVLGVSLLLAAAQMTYARQTAPVVMPWRALVIYGPAALSAGLLAAQIDVGAHGLNLVARVATLAAVCLLSVATFDRPLAARLFGRASDRRSS